MTPSHIRRVATAIVTTTCVLVSLLDASAQSAPPNQAAAPPAEPLSALAPENLAKPRPPAPFNMTGNWFIAGGIPGGGWLFGRTPEVLPKLTPAAQKHFDAYAAASKAGKVYRDDIGKCWPAGMPIIMTRVWPIATIQLPTAIYMVSEFMNSLRVVYFDRQHSDPDVVVRSHNGESIGRWEGDTLVIDTQFFIGHHHWIDSGIPASDAMHVVERVKMVNEGRTLEIEYAIRDPKSFEGEWKWTKRWNRVDDRDIAEVSCYPDLNDHMPSTRSKENIR